MVSQRPTLILIGGGSTIDRSRIISVIDVSTNSLPLKKYRNLMNEKGLVIDVTKGRKVRAMIVTDSNHLFLSGIHAETIKGRIEEGDDG